MSTQDAVGISSGWVCHSPIKLIKPELLPKKSSANFWWFGEVFENLNQLLTSLSCGSEKFIISIESFKSLLPTKIPPASGSKPSCLNSSNEFKISDGITI